MALMILVILQRLKKLWLRLALGAMAGLVLLITSVWADILLTATARPNTLVTLKRRLF